MVTCDTWRLSVCALPHRINPTLYTCPLLRLVCSGSDDGGGGRARPPTVASAAFDDEVITPRSLSRSRSSSLPPLKGPGPLKIESTRRRSLADLQDEVFHEEGGVGSPPIAAFPDDLPGEDENSVSYGCSMVTLRSSSLLGPAPCPGQCEAAVVRAEYSRRREAATVVCGSSMLQAFAASFTSFHHCLFLHLPSASIAASTSVCSSFPSFPVLSF